MLISAGARSNDDTKMHGKINSTSGKIILILVFAAVSLFGLLATVGAPDLR